MGACLADDDPHRLRPPRQVKQVKQVEQIAEIRRPAHPHAFAGVTSNPTARRATASPTGPTASGRSGVSRGRATRRPAPAGRPRSTPTSMSRRPVPGPPDQTHKPPDDHAPQHSHTTTMIHPDLIAPAHRPDREPAPLRLSARSPRWKERVQVVAIPSVSISTTSCSTRPGTAMISRTRREPSRSVTIWTTRSMLPATVGHHEPRPDALPRQHPIGRVQAPSGPRIPWRRRPRSG